MPKPPTDKGEIYHKKLHPLLTCTAAAALSLTLILSLAACGQYPADTGGSPPPAPILFKPKPPLMTNLS